MALLLALHTAYTFFLTMDLINDGPVTQNSIIEANEIPVPGTYRKKIIMNVFY